jgi:hypothetical protein
VGMAQRLCAISAPGLQTFEKFSVLELEEIFFNFFISTLFKVLGF